MSSCPPLEFLHRFGSDSPGGSTDRAVDAHINGCRLCQDVLDGLAAVGSSGAGRVDVDPENLPRIPGFTIERELGRGGMGVVFLARELHPDRLVAVKFLSIGPFAGPRDRDRWLKEARAAARVRHPHIVQLYRVDEAGGWPYLVLEYLPGGSLKERLTGPLSPRDAATLLVPVARALEQLHLAGVWHLDLKPANILIDAPPGTPLGRAPLKLTDFGIARSRDEADFTGSSHGGVRGTPLYIAPEQVAGLRKELGPVTDIHAMGSILYELLTGRPPFLAESDAETMHRVQTEDPLPPRRLNPRVPRDLETICLKCLAKEPKRRYPSAEALAEDLQCWLAGHPISARPVSSLERGWRWCRRHPSVAALAVALALSLTVGFLSVIVLWRHAETERIRAEAESVRAEEDFRTATDVLGQFVGFTTEIPVPKVLDDRSLMPLFQNARGRMLDFVRRRPGSDSILRELALVDLRLGVCLIRERRWDEARAILEESVERLDELSRRVPLDRSACVNYLWACTGCADVAEHQGRPDVSLSYRRRAVEAGEAIAQRWPSGEALVDLARMRSELASVLARRGDRAAARELLQANVSTFTPRPGLTMDHAGVAAWCILAPIEMNRHRSRFADPGTDRPTAPSHTANSSNPFALVGSPAMDALPVHDWAGVILDAMGAAVRDGERRLRKADVAYWFCRLWIRIAAEDRNHGKLEDSRRNVERLVELGRALVSRYPDQAESFLVLSTGYLNRSKIAWKELDYPAIERHLTQSVEAARQAVAVNPADQEARYVLNICQRKLDDFLKGRRQAASEVH
jgi:serine/threonine protein kinase/tetratricopeptide (TPR) repeat protein